MTSLPQTEIADEFIPSADDEAWAAAAFAESSDPAVPDNGAPRSLREIIDDEARAIAPGTHRPATCWPRRWSDFRNCWSGRAPRPPKTTRTGCPYGTTRFRSGTTTRGMRTAPRPPAASWPRSAPVDRPDRKPSPARSDPARTMADPSGVFLFAHAFGLRAAIAPADSRREMSWLGLPSASKACAGASRAHHAISSRKVLRCRASQRPLASADTGCLTDVRRSAGEYRPCGYETGDIP